jgi:hypothetical protein
MGRGPQLRRPGNVARNANGLMARLECRGMTDAGGRCDGACLQTLRDLLPEILPAAMPELLEMWVAHHVDSAPRDPVTGAWTCPRCGEQMVPQWRATRRDGREARALSMRCASSACREEWRATFDAVRLGGARSTLAELALTAIAFAASNSRTIFVRMCEGAGMAYRRTRTLMDMVLTGAIRCSNVYHDRASGSVSYACVDEIYFNDATGTKHCVVGVVEFDQTTRTIRRVFLRRVAEPTQVYVCHNFANQLLAFRATVVTDCAPMYLHGFDPLLAQTRHNNHSRDQYVLNDGATSNPGESLFAQLRRFLAQFFGTIRSGDHLDGIIAMFELRWRERGSWGEVAAAVLSPLLQWRQWEEQIRGAVVVAARHTAERAAFAHEHRAAITALARTRAAQAPQMAAGARHRDPLAVQRGPAFAQAPTGEQRVEREARVAAGVQRRAAVADARVLAFATPQGSQQDGAAAAAAAAAPAQLTQPSQRARRGAGAAAAATAVGAAPAARAVAAAAQLARESGARRQRGRAETQAGAVDPAPPQPAVDAAAADAAAAAPLVCCGCGELLTNVLVHPAQKEVDCTFCSRWCSFECSGLTEKGFAAVDEHDPTTFWWCRACDRAHGARLSSSSDDDVPDDLDHDQDDEPM